MPNHYDVFTDEFKDRGPRFRDPKDRLMLVWKDHKGQPYEESLRALHNCVEENARPPKEFSRALDAAREYKFE